jgi:hypothetical protein
MSRTGEFLKANKSKKIKCTRAKNAFLRSDTTLGAWATNSWLIVTNALVKVFFWWQYLLGHCAIAHSVAASVPLLNIKH